MRRAGFIVGVAALWLAACVEGTANVKRDYMLSLPSGNGVVIGSITSSGELAHYQLFYRRVRGGGDGYFLLDSADPTLNAALIAAELPTGDYEIYKWLISFREGGAKTEVSPWAPFSIPFHVAPGEAVYIGSCGFALKMGDDVGRVAAMTAACTDESERDLKELAARYPMLAAMTAGLRAPRAELYRSDIFRSRRFQHQFDTYGSSE